LTAAIVALPTSLAFGVSSGLGPVAGLYGAIACGICASLFGGTPALVTGPTGPMTVVVAAMLSSHQDRPELVFAAIIFGGFLQILLGRIRAGQLIHYIPYPVISGFMTGIGVIIIILQLRGLLGMKTIGSVLASLQTIGETFHHVNAQALGVGLSSLAAIYLLPCLSKRIPAALVALAIATSGAAVLHFDLPAIGSIPSTIPRCTLPLINLTDVHDILLNAITLAILGSMDSLLTSVICDRITRGRHDSDQELVGQGVGNIVSGLLGGLPSAGNTMLSVVSVNSGGRSPLAGVSNGLILLTVLAWLGPIVAKVPSACLAAILISVGISIIDYRGLKTIRKAPIEDVVVMLVVIALTVFADLIVAVGIGIALACILFAKRLSDARLSDLQSLESLEHLHEAAQSVPAELWAKVYIYTFNGPLFFGEVKNFAESVDKLSKARYIILGFSNVPIIDQTGAYAVEESVEKWEAKGIKVLFTGMQGPVSQTLNDMGVIHKIEMQNCFQHAEQAIESIAAVENDFCRGTLQDGS
jgi:sulfate permease, SulP family